MRDGRSGVERKSVEGRRSGNVKKKKMTVHDQKERAKYERREGKRERGKEEEEKIGNKEDKGRKRRQEGGEGSREA